LPFSLAVEGIAHLGILDDGVLFLQEPFFIGSMAVKLRDHRINSMYILTGREVIQSAAVL
jgi:hypothetical protein